MTKEVLRIAKMLDGNIAAINKLLKLLSNSQLKITNSFTGDEFRFIELDTDTMLELEKAMKDVLTKKKSSMINELEEL